MKPQYTALETQTINSRTKDNIINLVLHTFNQDKQVLIFNNSKRSSESTAEKIADAIITPNNQKELEDISNKILKALQNPTKQCKRLAKCVKKGIAFHHAGLISKQRELIEKNFKLGYIKAISSTPTLAAGLNLPAYKVIIKDYKRYSNRGMTDIPVLEFHQMSGRAGRPGKEKIGKAVLNIKNENELERVIPKYIFGKSEEILSKLAVEPTLKMYILSLISMDMINTKDEIKSFFSSTLYAHQYKDLALLNHNIFKIIEILKDYSFIQQDDDYYMATPLGKKISQLYLNPDTANYFLEHLDKFVKIFEKDNTTKHDIYSLINFIVNTMEMRPLFRVLKSEGDHYAKRIQDIADSLTVKFDPFEVDYEMFMNSIKTTDLFIDWINEAPEDYMTEKFNVTPGELNYKLELLDWLIYCLSEIAFLKKELYFKNYLGKLRIRFKQGIKEELLPLVSLKGVGRVRARKLFKSNLKTLDGLREAKYEQIAKVLGNNLTIKVKNQVDDNSEASIQALENFNNQKHEKPNEIKAREAIENQRPQTSSGDLEDNNTQNNNQNNSNKQQFTSKNRKTNNKSLTDFF